MVFTPDEEYLLYLAQTIIDDFHIIWIGVSALGLDFYMGPFWIYFISPFVAFSKGDPIILGVISSLLGVGTTFLLYLLGKKIINEKVGLISAFLYASLALLVYYDQQPYPPGVPFLSLLLILSLYMAKYSSKWWILFAVGYGMVFHIHLSLTLVIFVAIYWAYVNRQKLTKKIVVLSLLAFLLTISPLIAFDYFHKASNITAPLRVLQASKGHKINLDVRFENLFQSLSRVWFLADHKNSADEILYPCIISPISTTTKGNGVIALLTALLFSYFFIKRGAWKDQGRRLLLLFSLAFLIPFTILPVINPIEYYLLGFFPILILVITSVVDLFAKPIRLLSFIVLGFFALHGLYTVLTASGDFGIDSKKMLVTKVMEVIGTDSYEVKQRGQCHQSGGWRYLFSVYGRKPERSDEDEVFSWLYPDEVSVKPIKYTVIVEETRSKPLQIGYKYLLQAGGFRVYVFEH